MRRRWQKRNKEVCKVELIVMVTALEMGPKQVTRDADARQQENNELKFDEKIMLINP